MVKNNHTKIRNIFKIDSILFKNAALIVDNDATKARPGTKKPHPGRVRSELRVSPEGGFCQSLFHVEALVERDGDGGVVWVDLHDVSHVVPPFLDDGVAAEILGTFVALDFLIGEQDVGVLVPPDGVVLDAAVGQEFLEFGPDGRVPALVFVFESRFQEHFECFSSCHNKLVVLDIVIGQLPFCVGKDTDIF